MHFMPLYAYALYAIRLFIFEDNQSDTRWYIGICLNHYYNFDNKTNQFFKIVGR